MNPKPSNLAEHNSVLYSLRLEAGGPGIVADSCWRYFDAQIRITRHLQTFVADIKMLTLAPPPNTNETFSVLCIFFHPVYRDSVLSCSNVTDNSLTSANYKEP